MKTGTGLKYLFPFSLFQYVLGIKIKNMCPFAELFVDYSVLKLCKLASVPTAGCTYKVTGNTLELVNVRSAAVRTLHEAFLCILESAVHTTVTVVVD